MSAEAKQQPNSNRTRKAALDAGKQKQTAMGASSFITAPTAALLNTLQPAYFNLMAIVNAKKAGFYIATADKDVKVEILRKLCSHFIQVFFLATQRGVFPVGALAYYDVNEKGNLPEMITDAQVLSVAATLIRGDADRVADGGAAMAMPPISEVVTAKTDCENAMIAQNNAEQALKTAQINCNALNQQVDECLALLWGEIETHFVNLPRPTMRDEARLWGVIYGREGGPKVVSGTVKDSVTRDEIAGVNIYFTNGRNDTDSNADGYTLNTSLMDVQQLNAVHPLYEDFQLDVTLVEGQNPVINIEMVRRP